MKTASLFRSWLAALLTASALPPLTLAAPKIEEVVAAPAWEPGVILTLSPKGMHLASTRNKGSRFVVTLDGVDGEPFDQIYNAGIGFERKISQDGFFIASDATWTAPVVFSPDGTRHAYAARRGSDVIVMLDGKEIFKAPTVTNKSPANNLFFSPDGKHLFFLSQTDDSNQSWRLMMDGKPVTPAFEGVVFPTFSPDGSRWALVAPKPRQGNPSLLIIDGKDPGYFGERVQFTPDNKRVVCVTGSGNKHAVLLDGKPLVSGQGVTKVAISATGDIGTTVIAEPGRHQFFINGKLILDTTSDFVFSPNGKRWAAVQGVNRQFTVVVDGQKHPVVSPGPLNLQFSPDSTKVVYVLERGLMWHVVIDGKEGDGFQVLDRRPSFGQTGNDLLYVTGTMIGRMKVYHKDYVGPEEQRPAPILSPDGSRFAYVGKSATNDPIFQRLIVDRVIKEDARPSGDILFSPDSKHLVAQLNGGLFFNDQVVKVTARHPLGFTNDSRNLIFAGQETDARGVLNAVYFINGEPVARFAQKGMQFSGTRPKVWEEQPDGRIVFVGHVGAPQPGQGYGEIKRITVTPDPEGSATAWFTAVAEKEKADIAAAAAAKKKAEEDALAAAEKKKADAAAAAAKRKADAEAAAAAKAKARQDAINARKKK